jgi:hypothetical protein
MGRIAQVVKNIISGISQQPPIMRHMEQLQEQINGFSTEADGLQKRPPTVHIAELSLSTTIRPKIHVVNRDENEQYIMHSMGLLLKYGTLRGTLRQLPLNTLSI